MSQPDVLDVLVVGGGIIGLACARALAQAGLQVEIFERGEVAGGASGAAAGLLSPLTEAHDRGDAFFAACRAARDLWPSWREQVIAESGEPIEYDDSGALFVALDPEEDRELDRLRGAAAKTGEPVEDIPLAAALRWVPDLSPAARRVLLLSGEHRVDNVAACRALRIAVERCGVRIREHHEIRRVEARSDGVRVAGEGWSREARWLLLAAGAWSATIEGLPRLPLRPVRGQIVRLGGAPWPWGGSVHGDRHHYAVRRGKSDLLIGATVEEVGFENQTTPAGISALLAFARRVLPGLAGRPVVASWAGLRPGSPDGLPILGKLPGLAIIAATGHFRNGILLAPWTAVQVARILLGEEADPVLEAFSPARFTAAVAAPP